MHVLFVPDSYPNRISYASSLFIRDQALAVARQSVDIGVVSTVTVSPRIYVKEMNLRFGLQRSGSPGGINEHLLLTPTVPSSPRLSQQLRHRLNKLLIRRYISRYGVPDLIHSHVFYGGQSALWASELYGIPLVHTEHSTGFQRASLSDWQLELAHRVFAGARTNICVSPPLKAHLEQRFGVPFTYVPNPVDTDYFVPVPKPARNAVVNFLNVAHMAPKKNQATLIRAFSRLYEEFQNVSLTVAGDGPEYANIRNAVRRSAAAPRIALVGRATRQQVRELMQRSDVFVLPSLAETFGVVVIEAMSCGLPVIATRSGGPETIVVNEDLGLLADTSEEGIYRAMKEMMSRRFDPAKIRQHVLDHYAAARVGAWLVEIYAAAMGGQRGSAAQRKS
jgi:L-malate glycosyltransferase